MSSETSKQWCDIHGSLSGHGVCACDYENIGRGLMESIARNLPGYSWSDCPSEAIVDLVNQRDGLVQENARLQSIVTLRERVAADEPGAQITDLRRAEPPAVPHPALAQWIENALKITKEPGRDQSIYVSVQMGEKIAAALRGTSVYDCNVCGGRVDLSNPKKPTAKVGPGRPSETKSGS